MKICSLCQRESNCKEYKTTEISPFETVELCENCSKIMKFMELIEK